MADYIRGVDGRLFTFSASPNGTGQHTRSVERIPADDVPRGRNAADPAPNDMASIHTSPWGGVQSATVLAPA